MVSGLTTAVGVQVIIVLFIIFRAIRVYRGRALSPPMLFAFPVLTTLIFAATEAETVASIPSAYPLWALVDTAAMVAAALVTVPLAPRFVHVWKDDSGQFFYRYGIELIAFYLGMWVVRFALAAVYDPSSLAFDFSTPTTLSGTTATAMLIVQGLFAVSSGVVIGRAIGTFRLYLRKAGPPPLRSSNAPLR